MNCIKYNAKEVYPSKIICIGRNYAGHIKELGNYIPEQPVIFIKPNSAISDMVWSGKDETIHYEGEISFLFNSGEISGVGFGLDLTKREVQNSLKSQGLPWERSKAFEESAVFSDFIPLQSNIYNLKMELLINGKLIQSGSSELMLNKPQNLLREIKTFLTLEDGDLLMTGTPKGVGPVQKGEKFTGRIFDGEKLLIEKSWLAK